MTTISSEQIIENIKKAVNYYQEIIIQLTQNQPTQPFNEFYASDASYEVATKVLGQFLEHPEKFTSINFEYVKNLQSLVSDSITKFIGEKSSVQTKTSPTDKRFKDPAWQQSIYFDFIRNYYLISAEWIKKTVQQYELDNDGKRFLEFTARQFIDALSPTNFVFSNPEVIRESLESGMNNIAKGMENFLLDVKKSGELFNISTTDSSFFQVGKNIAVTKGKVIFQNDLMQLICYEPKEKTYKYPIFILPPWINKYYILDLSKENSLINWLVTNNFQVYLVSWVNPGKYLAHKNFEDYLREGVLEPLNFINKLGFKKVNALGYCIGGTLLAIALSYFKSKNKKIINSASFLATLLDFTNPGEIGAFINKNTIGYISNKVTEKGYLDGRHLSSSFSLIRANDLVWSYFVNNYLLGKPPAAFDILYWNSDATNLPAMMYMYYLQNMYIDNLLKVPNALKMLGEKVNLSKIDAPSFFLAAKSDHIALWQSVYDGVKLFLGDRTFCLTDAGHVAGIVNPSSSFKYSHLISNEIKDHSQEWLQTAKSYEGSWWNSWQKWLLARSGKLEKSINYDSLPMIEAAPGSYVKVLI